MRHAYIFFSCIRVQNIMQVIKPDARKSDNSLSFSITLYQVNKSPICQNVPSLQQTTRSFQQLQQSVILVSVQHLIFLVHLHKWIFQIMATPGRPPSFFKFNWNVNWISPEQPTITEKKRIRSSASFHLDSLHACE